MKKAILICLLALTGKLVSSQVTINTLQYTIYYDATINTNTYAYSSDAWVAAYNGSTVVFGDRGYYPGAINDSLAVVQGQSPPTSLKFRATETYESYDCDYGYWPCYYNYYTYDVYELNVPLRYPYFDTTINNGTAYIHIRVRPNLDNSNNMPTNEKVRIVTTGAYPYYATWQYQVGASTDWYNVPNATNPQSLDVSGYDLFGNDYINQLNQTVKFRLSYSTSYYGYPQLNSNILVFTHRLSAPTITNLTTNNISCNGEATGNIVITFSRPLLMGERLNLFLSDTLKFADYSALNIQTLSGSNTYTWTGELPASNYLLSMIGKYSPYLVNDLTANTTRGTGPHWLYFGEYWAQNSITFDPGFESMAVDSFETFIGGMPGGIPATYTGSVDHFRYFSLTQPTRIQYYTEFKSNVSCKGGNNGVATVYAKGGAGSYKYGVRKEGESNTTWTNFATNTVDPVTGHVKQDITGLTAGTFYISVRDANNCVLKDSIGVELKRMVVIREPAEALRLDLLEVTPITSVDSVNGKIKVRITGGTPYLSTEIPGYRYTFEWRDSATNQLITNFVRDTTGGKFEIRLANLNEGTYILKAYDNKYNEVTGGFDRGGCYVEARVRMVKPLPLVVSIISSAPVTCNGGNNGTLKAIAAGGHPLDSTRYQFTWFKGNGSPGTVQLSTGTDSMLNNVTAGPYYVEIQDRFSNKKTSTVFTVTQPTALQVTVSAVAATCYSTANGSVSAVASGGTPNYRYEWSTGQRTATVNNLPGGSYVVVVRDTLNCEVVSPVSITSPVQVVAVPAVTPVTCLGKTDGRIQLSVSGGVAPYTYQWSNGSTTSLAQNLPVGRHWYKVSDVNGCFAIDTIDLDTPLPFSVSLDPNRNICVGQVVKLAAVVSGDGPVTYAWSGSNGLSVTTPVASVTQAGTYIVAATNSRNCIAKDTIVLTPVSSTISTDYIVSTQTFRDENVVLVNISTPSPDSVQWILPATNVIQVVQKNKGFAELIFADTGRFDIAMKVFYPSGCVDIVNKQVIVVNKEPFAGAGSQVDASLKRFTVYPNPNSGQFNVELVFNAVTKARLRLINILTNVTINDRTVEGSPGYLLNYNYGGSIIAGTYVLVIETPKGNFVHKVTVQ